MGGIGSVHFIQIAMIFPDRIDRKSGNDSKPSGVWGRGKRVGELEIILGN